MDRKKISPYGRQAVANLAAGDLSPTVEQTFLLPFPPSTNNLFSSNRKTGRRFVNEKYAAWRREAGWSLKAQNPQPMVGDIEVVIRAIRPDNRRRDIDNLAKPINDLLVTLGVIADDSKITNLSMSWVSDNLQGVSVTVIGALRPR